LGTDNGLHKNENFSEMKMDVHDLNLYRHFSSAEPCRKVFHDSGSIKAQVVCIKAGQALPPCSMDNEVLFYIISGAGEISADGRWTVVKPGQAVVVPREAKTRSIRAEQDMVILAVQAR